MSLRSSNYFLAVQQELRGDPDPTYNGVIIELHHVQSAVSPDARSTHLHGEVEGSGVGGNDVSRPQLHVQRRQCRHHLPRGVRRGSGEGQEG
eukprot:312903-Prorocentrum_minimum.AAC.1